MSTLTTTQIRPGLCVRTVHRRDDTSPRAHRSPFAVRAAVGQAPLGALGIAPVAAIPTVLKLVESIPIVKNLFGSKPSRAEQTWDGYKPQAGRNPGTAYDEKGFAEIVKGAFDANRAVFNNDAKAREQFLANYVAGIAAAFKAGKIPVTASVPQVFESIGIPWLKSNVKSFAAFEKNPYLKPLFKDIAERYLANLPVTRANMAAFGSQYASYPKAPLILEALGDWLKARLPAPATGTPAAGMPAAPAAGGTVRLPTVPGLPKPPTATNLPTPPKPPTASTPKPPAASSTPAASSLPAAGALPAAGSVVLPSAISQLIEQMRSQGASQQDAFNNAIAAMQAQGVPTPPAVRDQVAQEVSAGATGAMSSTMKIVGIGAGVLLLGFALAHPKGKHK